MSNLRFSINSHQCSYKNWGPNKMYLAFDAIAFLSLLRLVIARVGTVNIFAIDNSVPYWVGA
jgi:hypothetical protein